MGGKGGKTGLFADDLDEGAFRPLAIELPVKDLFPRTKIQATARHGNDAFPAHDRTLEMRVGVILGAIVLVLGVGFFRGKFLQPFFEVGM